MSPQLSAEMPDLERLLESESGRVSLLGHFQEMSRLHGAVLAHLSRADHGLAAGLAEMLEEIGNRYLDMSDMISEDIMARRTAAD